MGDPGTEEARRLLVHGIGDDLAATVAGLSVAAGRAVAAMYLAPDGKLAPADVPRAIDASEEDAARGLAELSDAGIAVQRDGAWLLAGPYPDVIAASYLAKLRRVVVGRVALAKKARELIGEPTAPEDRAFLERVDDLVQKYSLFAYAFSKLVPEGVVALDVRSLISRAPVAIVEAVSRLSKAVAEPGDR